jgi:uncharacterized protein YjiS (DUF1127 family)
MSQGDFVRVISVRLLPSGGGIRSWGEAPWLLRRLRALELATAVRRAVSIFRLWRRHPSDRAALAALDDRLLDDIGLTRIEVVHASDKPFWTE